MGRQTCLQAVEVASVDLLADLLDVSERRLAVGGAVRAHPGDRVMLAHLLDDDDDAHLRCASAATSTRIVDESSRARCSDGLRKTRGPGRKAASLQRALVAFEKCARACETSRHAPSTCPDRSRPPHARCPQRPPCCEALSRGNFGAFSTRHSGQFTPDSTNHGLSDTLNHGLSDTLMASLTLSDTSCGAVPAFSNLVGVACTCSLFMNILNNFE